MYNTTRRSSFWGSQGAQVAFGVESRDTARERDGRGGRRGRQQRPASARGGCAPSHGPSPAPRNARPHKVQQSRIQVRPPEPWVSAQSFAPQWTCNSPW